MGYLFGQGCAGCLGQQLVVRHDGSKAETFVHVPLDRIHLAILEHAAGQAAQQCRSHVIRVSLDGSCQCEQLLRVEHIAQHPVCAQQTRDDAGRRGAQTPCHGDGVRLGDLEGRDLLAYFFKQSLGGAVHEIRLTPGDAGAVRCGDLQHLAVLKGDRVVQGNRQTQRIEAGAHVGTGGRD